MFLRSVKAPNGRHQYLRLVESVREGKKVKQRVVAHLGRKDQLAPHLDALIRLLQDETQAPRWLGADPGCLRAARLDLGSHPGGAPLVPPSISGHDFGWGASVAAPRTTVVRTHFPVAGESSHSSWQ